MSARRVVTLFVVAFLVGGLALYLSSRRQVQSANAAGALVLPELKGTINNVTELRLAKADGTRTTLKKEAAGWRVAERNFTADAGKVRKLLLELAALKVEEE